MFHAKRQGILLADWIAILVNDCQTVCIRILGKADRSTACADHFAQLCQRLGNGFGISFERAIDRIMNIGCRYAKLGH